MKKKRSWIMWIALDEDGEPICWDDDSTMFYCWNEKPLAEDFGLNEGEKIKRVRVVEL